MKSLSSILLLLAIASACHLDVKTRINGSMDPEGNKIELWEPVDSVFTAMGAATTK